jgi:acetate---CoA ligase (ADP-forming)
MLERLFHPRGIARLGPGDHVRDVPPPVDVAVIGVTGDAVLAAIEECGEAGVPFVIVTASAVPEERELLAAVRRHGMRMLGPNGSTNIYEAMPVAPGPALRKVALITQSGHMGRLISQAAPHGVAFSRWVPTGNEADLEAADFIQHFAEDPETAVIAGYVEGFRDGGKLRRALHTAFARGKPVVLIKVGRNQAASRMAETHSAHLTGSDEVIDGLFRQYGVVRVEDVDELIETAAMYAKIAPVGGSGRVALYGYAGGAVALMSEIAEGRGVTVPVLSDATQRGLHEVLPPDVGVSNPVDSGNLYREGTPEGRRRVFDLIGADPAVDVLVCASTGVIRGVTDDFISDVLAFAASGSKPVVVVWSSWETRTPAYDRLLESGLPVFRSSRGCFQALHGLFERRRRAAVIADRAVPSVPAAVRVPEAATRMLASTEAAALLERFAIPLVEERAVESAAAAGAAARALGFPVVLKASAPGVAHKSEAGLVRVGLGSERAVAEAWGELAGPAAAVVVQRQVEGVELILGVTTDATLGPAVLVGLGGVFAEILDDVSVRPVPLTAADAAEMIRDLRGCPLLTGARGRPPADVAAVESVILALARLAEEAPGIRSIDLNPVLAGERGAVAVDWLVELDAE